MNAFIHATNPPSLLFDHQLPFHLAVAQAAEVRALEGKRSCLIGGELDRGWIAFLQLLVDVESLELEAVVVVDRCDDQLDVRTFLDGDHVGVKPVLPGGHLDLGSRASARVLSADSHGRQHEEHCNNSANLPSIHFSLKSSL